LETAEFCLFAALFKRSSNSADFIVFDNMKANRQ